MAAANERIAANELRANEIKRASEENKQKITAAEETICGELNKCQGCAICK